MDLQPQTRGATQLTMPQKAVAVLMSIVLAVGLCPIAKPTTQAWADDDNAAKIETAKEKQQAFDSKLKSGNGKVDWNTLIRAVLAYNAVKTLDDAEVKKLTNYYAGIETLDLSGQNIKDSIYNDQDVGSLVPFIGLKKLSLANTNVNDIGALVGMTALTDLDLSGNKGVNNFGVFAQMASPLVNLNLSGTGFGNAGYGALIGLKDLRKLDLSSTDITTLGPVTTAETKNQFAKDLTDLNVSGTKLTHLQELWPAGASGLPALKTLYAQNLTLSGVPGQDEAEANAISGIVEIANHADDQASGWVWDLTGSTVGNAAKSHVDMITTAFTQKNLGTFNPPHVKPAAGSGAVPESLTSAESWLASVKAKLASDGGKANLDWNSLITLVYWYRTAASDMNVALSSIDISKANDSSAEGRLAAVKNGLLDITDLDMSGKKESKYAISTGVLTDMTKLTHLNLSDTGIGEAGGLVGLSELKTLDLSKNPQLNATMFGALQMTGLTELSIAGTGVTELGGLTASGCASTLEKLDISDTGITKLQGIWQDADKLPALKELTAKNLSLSSITGLAEIALVNGRDFEGVSWDLGGSSLSDDEVNSQNVYQIGQKLGDGFKAPAYRSRAVVSSDLVNGSITLTSGSFNGVASLFAAKGDSVTVNAIPSDGYQLESITVKAAESGEAKTYTSGTFAMPGENVSVSASFKERSETPDSTPTADAAKVKEVQDAIDALPEEADVTLADKAAVKAAKSAYDALNSAERARVTADKLTAALTKLETLDEEAAKPVQDAIDALGDSSSEADVRAAKAAYDKLDADQKKLVSAGQLDKLNAAVAKADEAAAARAEADKEAANRVAALIGAADPASPATVEAARAAYDALTDAQKALVGDGGLERLADAEAQVAADREAAEAAAAKAAADRAAADAVSAQLAGMDAASAAEVASARAAYDALTADQRALVDAASLKRLADAEAALASPPANAEVDDVALSAGSTVDVKVTSPSSKEVAVTDSDVKSGSSITVNTVQVEGTTYKVTAIAANAFKGTKAAKVTVGSNVKTIGASAFAGAPNLKSATVGDNVTKIGAKAFYGDKKLKSLTVGKKVRTVGKNPLKGCKKLTKVTVKSSKLTKSSLKNLVKGSKVKTVKLKGVSKKAKAKYKKWAPKGVKVK